MVRDGRLPRWVVDAHCRECMKTEKFQVVGGSGMCPYCDWLKA